MKLVCVREGRMGFHIGDEVYVPDETEIFDSIHFAIAEDKDAKKAKAVKEAELAEHQRLIDEQNAIKAAESVPVTED